MKTIQMMAMAFGVLPLAVMSAHALTLGEALDAPALSWATMGTGPVWTPTTTYSYDSGASAMCSFTGGVNQAWLGTTIQGPATATFWWATAFDYISGWMGAGYLEVTVDGSRPDSGVIVGTTGWNMQQVYVASGPHYLRWNAVSQHKDCRGSAYVDGFSLSGMIQPSVTVTNYVPVWITNGFVTITNGFITVTNTLHQFDAAVTVQKPVEGAVIKAKALRGIKLKGIAATSGMVPIIGVQASADDGHTWSAGLVTDKGTWKINDAAPYAQGAVTLRVRAVSASNDVSQATQRHVTIERR